MLAQNAASNNRATSDRWLAGRRYRFGQPASGGVRLTLGVKIELCCCVDVNLA
jgi:hypothetical protein